MAKYISPINPLVTETLITEPENVGEHQIRLKYCEGLKNILRILAEISLLLAIFIA